MAVVVRVSMLRSSYRARQQVDAGVYTGEEKLLYIYIYMVQNGNEESRQCICCGTQFGVLQLNPIDTHYGPRAL